MKLDKCKRCHSALLFKETREVETIEEDSTVEVEGLTCDECGCFHFNLHGVDIFEFFSREQLDKSAETVGKYVTDYDVKLKEKDNVL